MPHYAANITGHGWRKLLRHPARLTYRIHTLPPVPPVLRFIQQHAGIDDREAYGTLNMGAGFALFVAAGRGRARAWRSRAAQGVDGLGRRRASRPAPKQLLIEPLGLAFAATTCTCAPEPAGPPQGACGRGRRRCVKGRLLCLPLTASSALRLGARTRPAARRRRCGSPPERRQRGPRGGPACLHRDACALL
ncbi:MAG: hypothetical protein MZW92_48140 [Comamonadaceae bacterium]|nr:hypothetical protein [Comamonadaceae bacterium]